MNVSHESTGALTAKVKISFNKSEIEPMVSKKLREYGKKVNLPGFRDGKVPLGLVDKMYGTAIKAEVMNDFVSEKLLDLIIDFESEIMLSPLPNKEHQKTIDLDIQEEFDFYFDIAFKPKVEVNLEEIEGLVSYIIKVEDDDIEESLTSIRTRYGKFEQVDDVAEGDTIDVEIEEVNDAGEKFSGGINSTASILIDKIVDEDLKKKFIGAKVGTEVRMDLMAAFDNKTEVAAILGIKLNELAEPLNMFDLKIYSIKRNIPAELNKELFKRFDPSINTEDEMRTRLGEELKKYYNSEATLRLYHEAINKLNDTAADIEIPEEFLKKWLVESTEHEHITEENIDDFFKGYADQLKTELLTEAIMPESELKPTDEEFNEYIATYMQMPPEEERTPQQNETIKQVLQSVIEQGEHIKSIASQIMENKLKNFVLGNISFIEKEVSVKEFLESRPNN